jgi:HPt (histidine-containing phosphotransfer) domain-containing protein
MSHTEFVHLLSSINALSPEQMRQLCHELETKLAEAEKPPAGHGQGSLGAMRDAAEELDEAVEHAMQLRQRAWRLPTGE